MFKEEEEEEEEIKILKILSLTNMNIIPSEHIITLKKHMVRENISQKFRLKNIDKTRNYFVMI